MMTALESNQAAEILILLALAFAFVVAVSGEA